VVLDKLAAVLSPGRPESVSLLRQNPGVVTRDGMVELCRQFGTSEVFVALEGMGVWKS
jgi:hypothetical protein